MLAYRETGAEVTAGNVVVLLHGMFGSKGNLMSVAQALSDRFHIIALDLPGHGQSPAMTEMSFSNMAAAVKELLDHLGHKKAHLIGHSLGGKIAIQLASSEPLLPLSVTVLDIAPVLYTGGNHDNVFSAVASTPLADLKSRNAALEHFTNCGLDEPTAKFILTNLKRSSTGYEWRINFDLLSENYGNLSQAPVLEHAYAGPALVLKGAESAYIQTKHQDAFDTFLPHAEHLVIAGVGHWLHAEKPVEVQSHIDNFLSKIV